MCSKREMGPLFPSFEHMMHSQGLYDHDQRKMMWMHI